MGLGRQQRLRGASAVSRVITGTRPLQHGGLSLRALRDRPGEKTRFSVVVPISVHAGAVGRNTLRRRIAETLRRTLHECEPLGGMSVVFMARRRDMNPGEIKESIVLLLKKSGILQQ